MCVGAIRMVDIGAQRMFERLIAVDDEEHCMCGLYFSSLS